jgi:hypothetical protein
VRGLARCNRPAILARALQAQLDDGRRVRFTGGRTFPSSRPAQRILYIDDGTGTLHGEHLLTGAETLIASATGQETVSFTLRHPIVTAPTVRKDGVILEPGVDYDIDIATGEVAWIAGTTPGSAYTTDAYRHWTGLVAEAHRLIYGDPADLANVPPYVGDGVSLLVRGASSMIQAIAASGTVLDGYGVDEVLALAQSRLVTYVNTREIGGPLVSGQLVKVAMGVDGMFDFDLLDFEDVRPPENVAVRTSASIVTITEQQI